MTHNNEWSGQLSMYSIVRHYTKTAFQPLVVSGASIVSINLGLEYIEEEIIEGVHGPVVVGVLTVEKFFLPRAVAQATLYYRASKWPDKYKYDFVVAVDLSWLQKSEEGNRLLATRVLPYENRQIHKEEFTKLKQERELLNYLGADLSCSFDTTILRALGVLHMCPEATAPAGVKKEYIGNLVQVMKTMEFVPKPVSLLERHELKKEYVENFYRGCDGGYVYAALRTIIEELEEKTPIENPPKPFPRQYRTLYHEEPYGFPFGAAP